MGDITSMPGRTVPVVLTEASMPRAAVPRTEQPLAVPAQALAPYGFGFAPGQGVPLAVHVARGVWNREVGRRFPLHGVVLDRRLVAWGVCGALLVQRTVAPRYELLEDFCPGCVRAMFSGGSFLRLK